MFIFEVDLINLEKSVYKKNHGPHESPLVIEDDQGKKIRNPNEITVRQHVIPQAHLEEWAMKDGLINVFSKQKNSWFTPKPQDAFVVHRLWDQWTEQDFLRSIEKNYQDQVDLLKSGGSIENNQHVSAYFVTLCIRAHAAALERPNYDRSMEGYSEEMSQSELEDVELQNVGSSAHMSYPGSGSSQSGARDAVKMMMNMKFVKEVKNFEGVVWNQFLMRDDCAVLPDSFWGMLYRGFAILPVTPKIVLIGSRDGSNFPGEVLRDSSFINQCLIDSSDKYLVAATQIF